MAQKNPITKICFYILLISISDLRVFGDDLAIYGRTTFRSWRSDRDQNLSNRIDQNLRISAKKITNRDLDLKINLRFKSGFETGDRQFRSYATYVSWRNVRPKIDLKIGRMYPEIGSASGGLDGLDLTFRPTKNLKINGFAGIPINFYRSDQDRKFDRFQFGSGFSFSRLPKFRIEGYFAQQIFRGETDRQIVSLSGYGTPIRNLTIYCFVKNDLQNREPTIVISQFEYKLFRRFSIITKYTFNSYNLEIIDGRSNYREATIGADLRVGRRLFLRSEYGAENVNGDRSPNFRMNLTFLNFLIGADLIASYRLRGGSDRRFQIYSISVDRDFTEWLNLKIDWRDFVYRSDLRPIYSWNSVRFGASFRMRDRLNFSSEIERIDRGDLRVLTSVSYRF